MFRWADNKLVKQSAIPSNGRTRHHNSPHYRHHHHNHEQLHKILKNDKLIVRRYGSLPGSVPLGCFNNSKKNTGEVNFQGSTMQMAENNHSITRLQNPIRRLADNASLPKTRHGNRVSRRMIHDSGDADIASTNFDTSSSSGELKMMVRRLGGYDSSIQFVIQRWPRVGEIFIAAVCTL